MSQHDLDIANQAASNARADINLALKALASTSSGTSDPSTTYANMLFYNTSTNLLRLRNEANSGWINLGYVDQSSSAFRILNDTQVTSTTGSQTGLLGDQATSAWTTGTSTTESLVSPAKIKAAVDAGGSSSITTNGYQVLPSGLIMQWGQVTGVNATQLKTVTFPLAFPTTVFSINVTPKDNRSSGDFEVDLYSVAAMPISLTQFTIMQEGTSSGGNQTMMFMAYGN